MSCRPHKLGDFFHMIELAKNACPQDKKIHLLLNLACVAIISCVFLFHSLTLSAPSILFDSWLAIGLGLGAWKFCKPGSLCWLIEDRTVFWPVVELGLGTCDCFCWLPIAGECGRVAVCLVVGLGFVCVQSHSCVLLSSEGGARLLPDCLSGQMWMSRATDCACFLSVHTDLYLWGRGYTSVDAKSQLFFWVSALSSFWILMLQPFLCGMKVTIATIPGSSFELTGSCLSLGPWMRWNLYRVD